MRRNISVCPVCDSALHITELTCFRCHTRLHGNFDRPPLARIAPEHQAFIETFVRCRGIIRDVERALGLSYPTIRARLDAAVEALEEAVTQRNAPETFDSPNPERERRRRSLLRQVEEGNLEPEQAAELLRHI